MAIIRSIKGWTREHMDGQPTDEACMKDIARRGALVGISIMVALLVAELLLRAIGYSVPLFYLPDPRLGWILRPGAEGWYTDEGRAFMRVNSAGMRDHEHQLAKPEGVYRIAVLGDSY